MTSTHTGGRLPLRVTLVATMAGLAALGLLIAGFASIASLRGFLLDQVDRQLIDVANSVIEGPLRPGPEHSDEGGPPRVQRDVSISLLAADGTLTIGVGSSGPEIPRWTQADVRALDGKAVTLPSLDGSTSWRAIAVPASTGSVVVAQNVAAVDSTVGRLVGVELVSGAIIVGLLALLGVWVVRRALRPLTEVEATAAEIAAGDLSRRVPPYPPTTEVGSLALSLNSMLGQIESAFRSREESEAAARNSETRMRQFVADASHELRTPLTSIRGYSELYRQGALPDQVGVDRAMQRIEGEAVRMGGLVDDLLTLARHDQARDVEYSPVDVAAIARDAGDDARAGAPARSISINAEGPALVAGDEPALRQVIGNLVSNALQHTAGSVRLGVSAQGDVVVVTVADDGPGLAPEDAAHMFDRFFRVDAARTRVQGGSGLGLSIVQSIVDDHGGTISLDTAPDRGTTITVTLPTTRPSPP
ncbi:MAG: HAMP domain-containing sensor histidine kinase [Actinobacteria bacterium]|nr:HAMP domain-containing sensor histidine kinase [Actinomycetota bacterium]